MASAQGPTRHLECGLCMELFTSPRFLPCHHTFCLACLQRLVQSKPRSKTFPCPSCRATVTIPKGGVEKFQVNFYIESDVASQHAGTRMCEMCQKNVATHKCTDCDQFACDTCTAIHASIAATRSHTVLQMTSAQGSGHSHVKVTRERYCATHKDEKIRFFCNQCSTVICRDCKLTSHEGHATTDFSSKSSEAKELVKQVMKLSREKLEPKLRKRLREAEDHQKNLPTKKKEILALMERRAEELKQQIDMSLLQAKQNVDKETGILDKTVATCVDNMNMEQAGFLSLMERAERVIQSGCDADIMEMPRLMKQYFTDEEKQVSTHMFYTSFALDSKPSCKLQSFMDSKWKVIVKMKDDTARCMDCGQHYDMELSQCPGCAQENMFPPVHHMSHGYYAGKQCRSCGEVYAPNSRFCLNCGAKPEDDKTTIQNAITAYIGEVIKTEAGEEENNALSSPTTPEYSAWGSAQRNHGYATNQVNPCSSVQQTKEGLSLQIMDDIHAIQSLLAQWLSECQIDPMYQFQ
ncbi:uncharacterized protein LOC143277738 [Babylonia areolata]|uniref:uncharacterized protein LOC143277738 n=1 Tax=Babylonia areolata TaxID=304850 RepID=UPI003FD4F89D